MGRELRRVPKNWKHPTDSDGEFIPLFNGDEYYQNLSCWDNGAKEWENGRVLQPNGELAEITSETCGLARNYEEWAGRRPSSEEYMPQWKEEELTHFMMYETCTEGTPISPAFETIEELAQWLSDNNVSAFGKATATYEQWLNTCKRGWAPSAYIDSEGIHPGVALRR